MTGNGGSLRDHFDAKDSAQSIELANLPTHKSGSSAQEQPAAHARKPTQSFVRRDAETYGVKYKPERQWGFWNPQQAKDKHLFWIRLLGRVGWAAKAVIYSLIGGLACDNAIGNKNSSASPQGAFVLIGTANGGRGALVVLAIATATYSAWRFWEAIVGQGYDDNFSKWKNFFKFRLSPFVSGSVYIAYDVLIITTIPRDADQQRNYLRNSTWPNNWRHSGVGKAFLVIVGLAFIAATIVQLEQFFTKSFHNTIKTQFHYMPPKYWKAFRIFVLTSGHLGVLGRAGIFIFASVLFFRTLRVDTAHGKSVFGDALDQLTGSKAGTAALFIMGFLVIVYGLFAVLNMYARFFPTPPPTGYKKQHRRQYDADGILPQFASQESGFAPMGAAAQRQNPNGTATGTIPAHQHPSYLSPMTNAVNHQRTGSASGAPGAGGTGIPTGYPDSVVGHNRTPPQGIVVRQIGDEV